jgi:hypothetical protein
LSLLFNKPVDRGSIPLGVGVNEGRRQLRDGVGQGVFGFVGDPVGLGEADRGIDVEFGLGVDAVPGG